MRHEYFPMQTNGVHQTRYKSVRRLYGGFFYALLCLKYF